MILKKYLKNKKLTKNSLDMTPQMSYNKGTKRKKDMKMEINYKTKKLTEVNDLCIDKKDLGCVFYIDLEDVDASFLVTHYDTDFQMTNLESWITYSLTDFKEKFGYAYAERWIIESITLQ